MRYQMLLCASCKSIFSLPICFSLECFPLLFSLHLEYMNNLVPPLGEGHRTLRWHTGTGIDVSFAHCLIVVFHVFSIIVNKCLDETP